MGADRLRRGTQAGRRGSATEQAGVDWSNIDPYEEGRAGDLPYDDRVLFGDFASQLLNDVEPFNPSRGSQQHPKQMRLRGAGSQSAAGPSERNPDDPGSGPARQDVPSHSSGKSRNTSGSSSLQEGPASAQEAGGGSGEVELREGAQQPARSQTLGSTKKVGKTRGKKKLPVPDLDAIDDPEERRRQRRLVKNRNTAAASRERKAREHKTLAARTSALEQENAGLRQLLEHRDLEITHLQEELSQISGGPSRCGGGSLGSGSRGGSLGGCSHGGSLGGCSQGGSLTGRSGSAQPCGGGPAAPAEPERRALPRTRQQSLSASGTASGGMSGFVRGLDGQFLRLRQPAQLAAPVTAPEVAATNVGQARGGPAGGLLPLPSPLPPRRGRSGSL